MTTGLRATILLTISESLAIGGVIPPGENGSAYSQTLTARGGLAPYVWTLESGALPAGFDALDTDSDGNLVIGGTPTEWGDFPFTIKATDAEGRSAARSFTLVITPLILFMSGSAPDATVGVPYSYTYTNLGGIPPYFAFVLVGGINGGEALPAGLSITFNSDDNLVLSGTPTESTAARRIVYFVTDFQSPSASLTYFDELTVHD